MSFASQVNLLRAAREILWGDARRALPGGSGPKPDYWPDELPVPLPRSTPEEEGLDSGVLTRFYQTLSALPGAHIHTALALRHGKVVAEGYFSPFRKDVWQVTHSLCKTIVGAAAGIAVGEGLFSPEDPVIPYFPKESGLLPSRQLRAIQVRHLLGMCSGITFNEMSAALETDWLRGIFSSPIAFEPGSRFVYNSMNSYLLAALVCRASGQTLVEYLTPRLFSPLGFGALGWETSPEGIEKGGWGLYMMPEDMAKLGQLYLQKGRWPAGRGHRQLVPAAWVEASTRAHLTAPCGFGYGYQCWIDTEHPSYILNGMFGQYVSVFPQQEMVFVLTAGSPQLFAASAAYRAMTACVSSLASPPAFLPPHPAALSRLRRLLSQLRFGEEAAGCSPPAPPRRKAARRRAERWRGAPQPVQAPPQTGFLPFCDATWRFLPNGAGLLPLLVQAMDNNFSGGVRAVHLRSEPDGFSLIWEEGDGAVVLPVGGLRHKEGLVCAGRESFLAASRAEMRRDEDDEPVLVVKICFLEHSSFRILKFRRRGEELLLNLEEEPPFRGVIEAAMRQNENTAATPAPALGALVRDAEYLEYRLARLCAPVLRGVLAEGVGAAEGNEDG